MKQEQSERLWSVSVTGGVFSSLKLWILADEAEIAIGKARKWLKKNGKKHWAVKAAEHKGVIDAF